jgi:prefoldin subunit 5
MSSEEIVQQLQDFVLETGRLPGPDEPGLKELIEAAVRTFGSLENALGVAGLLTESHEEKTFPKRKQSISTQTTRKKNTVHAYPEDYFLSLLNLKRKQPYGSLTRDGTPTWWERRAKMSYNCSSCLKPIEKGERYIGCKKLHPGVRGIYGHRGTYSTDYYHVVCLLGKEKKGVESRIDNSNSEIKSIQREISEYREIVSAKKDSIEACKNTIRQVKEDYERTRGLWKKASGWFKCTYTSWSRNRKISSLEDEIAHIERREIPERQSKVGNLTALIESLQRRSDEIGARMQELTSSRNS